MQTKPMIRWYYFLGCIAFGLAPYIFSIAVFSVAASYGCTSGWVAACPGYPLLAGSANFASEFGLLFVVTAPIGFLFFVGGVAINWNTWVFAKRRSHGDR
ncbi:MAG: hypothetical protein ABI893_15005 [Polaromonas sp.]|uniref:hypothetical protein n=1 Tax=Polaromonas sp. TaxID=1869339 RepID=UPI00326422FF